LIYWTYSEVFMILYLSTSKNKLPVYIIFFILSILLTQKRGWRSGKYFFLEKGSTDQNFEKRYGLVMLAKWYRQVITYHKLMLDTGYSE